MKGDSSFVESSARDSGQVRLSVAGVGNAKTTLAWTTWKVY